MNGVLVGMEYAKAINTTQIESAVGRTEYGIFYVFAVQSTVQLIEPGETDVRETFLLCHRLENYFVRSGCGYGVIESLLYACVPFPFCSNRYTIGYR